jgi:hypothetical protein
MIVWEEMCFKNHWLTYKVYDGWWLNHDISLRARSQLHKPDRTQNNQNKHLWHNLSSPLTICNSPDCSIKFIVQSKYHWQTKVLFVLACRLRQTVRL